MLGKRASVGRIVGAGKNYDTAAFVTPKVR